MEQNLLVPKRSIKPYTKDRTKMTITKEDLRDYPRRDRLAKIARHIEFINTCLGALPHFPANQEAIEGYLEQMQQACDDMEKELMND